MSLDSQSEWTQLDDAMTDDIAWRNPNQPTYIPEEIECSDKKISEIKQYVNNYPNSYLIIKNSETGFLRLDERRKNVTYKVMFKSCLKDAIENMSK